MDLEKLKYPIGKWSLPEVIDSEMINAWIEDIAGVPGLLSNLVNHGKEVNLELTYRNGGLDDPSTCTSPGRQSYQCLRPP